MTSIFLSTSLAAACGGLFCNTAAPVDQAAEEIVFALDKEAGEVEMHIEITYEGSAADFAWVLPVPSEPEIFLSETQLFTDLSVATVPTFTTSFETLGRCGPIQVGCYSTDSKLSVSSSLGNSVTVIDTEQVGPFDTVTLQAANSQALLGWLVDNGYDLPPDLDPLLAPYVAEQSYFVAMRLTAGASVGEIEPIGLRFAGDEMAIPIQLTAIAAADDMPLRVYIFGDSRAVPKSYLGVEINEAAIDWTTRGANYPQVLSAAVDAAAGQAFVTEFSGETALANSTSPQYRRLVGTHSTLTRMTTTLSPEEMTVDPSFDFDPKLPPVAKDHTAVLVTDCRGGGDDNPPQFVQLEDGREVWLGDGPDAGPNGIADLLAFPALKVWDLADGRNELLIDFTPEADDDLERHNGKYAAGCGCNSAPVPIPLFLVFGLALISRRRR